MKKNAPNSRPGSAGNRAPSVSTRARTTTETVRVANTARRAPVRKKKSNTPKIIGISVASILLVSGLVAGCYFLTKKDGSSFGNDVQKYSVTMADGTVAEMTAEDMLKELNAETFYTGISIDGIDMSGKTKDEALALVAAQIPSAPVGVDINLNLDGNAYPVDLSSLSLESNYIEVIENAYAFARPAAGATSDDIFACYQNYQLLKATPNDFVTAYTVNTDNLSGVIHGILDPLNSEKVEAQINSFNIETCTFDVTESKDGYEIDIEKAVADTKALLDSRVYQGTIVVDAEVTKPTLSSDEILNGFGMISKTSSKTTESNSRNHNIRITCEQFDGMILYPGESFSFNGIIGQRTPEKGYELAPTIQGGKSEPGYGGGICQLSTMIYQSVVKADLQVDERHPHQWPSSYCVTGTDAAVDWPSQDFAFTNNSDYPIAIHSYYDVDNYIVTVELYGHLDPDGVYIDIEGETLYTSAAGDTEYIANPNMSVGKTDTIRSAHNGVSATSYKVWYDASGNEIKREEYFTSYYPKINAQVEVGVLQSDGTLATMDPKTGAVTTTTTETTVDPSASSETTSSSETSETTAATEATTPAEIPAETPAEIPTEPSTPPLE